MSKKAKIGIVVGAVLLLALLLYFFGRRPAEEDQKFVTDKWEETYHPSDKGPYGTYVLKELLDTAGMFGNFIQLYGSIEGELKDHPDINDIYFFVGLENYMPDSSAEYLLEFVEKGNTAFIAAHKFPEELEYQFFYNDYDIFINNPPEDSIQYLKFTHPHLASKRHEFKYIYNNIAQDYGWMMFDEDNFNLRFGEDPLVLGTNTVDQWCYVKIKYGEGYIFLHSIPYCFTNISMMKRDGFMYAERVLEHIPPGRVQWDRYNLKSHTRSGRPSNSKSGGERRRSILEFIVNHPPLFWALIILIVGGILYALFKGKRMQQVIPAAELKQNTSLEYINTLSSLYMQQGSHSKLIRLKQKTFLNFIAEKYYLITKKADDRFIEKVAVKSRISKEEITSIFAMFDQLNDQVTVSDQELIELHKKTEYFYKNCR